MLAALLLAITPAPLVQDIPTLSVRELRVSYWSHDGEIVRVQGWLGKCTRKKCRLQAERNDEYASISLGKSATLDRRAAHLRSRRVTVEGTVRAGCFEGNLIHTADGSTLLVAPCGARPPQLADPRIVDSPPPVKR